jgi:hypothetical protein
LQLSNGRARYSCTSQQINIGNSFEICFFGHIKVSIETKKGGEKRNVNWTNNDVDEEYGWTRTSIFAKLNSENTYTNIEQIYMMAVHECIDFKIYTYTTSTKAYKNVQNVNEFEFKLKFAMQKKYVFDAAHKHAYEGTRRQNRYIGHILFLYPYASKNIYLKQRKPMKLVETNILSTYCFYTQSNPLNWGSNGFSEQQEDLRIIFFVNSISFGFDSICSNFNFQIVLFYCCL